LGQDSLDIRDLLGTQPAAVERWRGEAGGGYGGVIAAGAP